MKASLVYDGQAFSVPASMGIPSDDQLIGNPLENLGEVASRICYDSLGYDERGNRRGRSSVKLHEHIKQVRNHSVYEHSTFTVILHSRDKSAAISCLNRKGVHVEFSRETTEITVNFRAVLEWDQYTTHHNRFFGEPERLGDVLRWFAHHLAPVIFPEHPVASAPNGVSLKTADLSDDQAHVSLWLYGSRGFTHEQVRHRFAMSHRSTRYVDEDGSPYVEHPLVTKFRNDKSVHINERAIAAEAIKQSIYCDRMTYGILVKNLERYGLANGLDKQTARKQARGAARGYLGNALASEMIFTAPISGWKWMLSQRKSKLADAEIREIYGDVLIALKSSQYGDRFAGFETIDSPDGLGTVLK